MDDQGEITDLRGTLRVVDGRGVVRVEHRFPREVADVWAALVEAPRLGQWMAEIDGIIEAGGRYRQRVFASGWEGTVSVDAFEAPERLRLTERADEARVPVIEVEMTLRAVSDGTALVLEATGMPRDLLFAYGAGWQIHVEDLGDYLAGRARRLDDDRWDQLEPRYQELAARLE